MPYPPVNTCALLTAITPVVSHFLGYKVSYFITPFEFLALLFIWLAWQMFIVERFLDPLRKLPGPKVVPAINPDL